MTPQSLSDLWAWLAPAAANHLWQSTVFALGAGALTLLLRKNQARARYWLWLAASVKFLVPFALLMALGTFLAPARAPAGTPSGYSYATEISQPFTEFSTPVIAPSSAHHLSFSELLPVALLLLWLAGFVAVLASWFLRWRRIRATVRRAVPVDAGREVEVLRRLERANGMYRPVCLRLSAESLEPGVFGIFRPVLLWPEGISARLSDEHLEAILAHELQHIRCRDNLAAAMHAIVQAIFWFHPLVWWMGAQMVRERERGCDEKVVETRSPGVYAEGILKTCEHCIAAPLAAFSGVAGADLKQRIVRIMSGGAVRKLDLRRKLLLAVAALAALAAPLALGLIGAVSLRAQLLETSGPLPSFEVATIKPSRSDEKNRMINISPGGLNAEDVTIRDVIDLAYDIGSKDQLAEAPSWVETARYDIHAKMNEATYQKVEQLPSSQRVEQIRLMTQALLANRFRMRTSVRTEELPVYALIVAKGGAKLKPAAGSTPANASGPEAGRGGGALRPGITMNGHGNLTGVDAPMGFLAKVLPQMPELEGRVVLDETGLKGYYDWTMKWSPADFGSSQRTLQDGTSAGAYLAGASGPSLFTALQEQLGLKLVPRKGLVQVLVVDHVERPSEN